MMRLPHHRCSVRKYRLQFALHGWYAVCLEFGCNWATTGLTHDEVVGRALDHTHDPRRIPAGCYPNPVPNHLKD